MTMINFNQNNTLWQNWANQNFSAMFGNFGGTFGTNLSIFGSMTGCTTMGYASVNYDAMAGMAVANSVLGTIGQAVSQSQSERHSEKATYAENKAQIENIDRQIADLNAKDPEKEIGTKYDTDIKSATNKQTSAEKALTDAKTKKTELETKLTTATEAEKTNIQKQIDDLKINDKEKAVADAKTEVESAQKAKTDAVEAKKKEINQKIEELKAQKAKLQAEVDNYELDKADGIKLQRTSDKKYNERVNSDGTLKDDVEYTKRDLRTAINRFMNALDGSADKYNSAKTVVAMYKRNAKNGEVNGTLNQAATIALRYINEHDEN